MKTYFLAAAAMLAVPTAANAAVTITFSDPTAGKGVISIDTDHLGLAQVDGDTTTYAGDGVVPFLTASFVDVNGNQRLLQRGALDGYVALSTSSSTISVSYTLDDGSPQFPTSTLVFSATGAQIGTFDGVRLPDVATATSIDFSVTSPNGDEIVSTPGGVTAATVAVSPVPEPASWALMIAGFAATGAALRRRRPIAATA
jgi:hypothetical protein